MCRIWFLLLLAYGGLSVYGQNGCENVLLNANKLYKEAKFSEVIMLLKPCISELDKESKIDAWRLLALANQNLNNNDSTLLAIKEMLKLNPKYQLVPHNDPTEFRRRMLSIKVRPILYGGIRVGIAQNTINLLQSYSALNVPQAYNNTQGYNIGFNMVYLPKPSWALESTIDYNTSYIKHIMEAEHTWIKTYTENLQFVSLAVKSRKYINLSQNIKMGLGGHLGCDYLIKTNATLVNKTFNSGSTSISSKNPIDERNRFQTNFGLIGNVEYALSQGFVVGIDFGKFWYTSNLIQPDNRMSDTDFIFNTLYTNDDIQFRKTSVLLTFKVPLKYKIQI